MGDFEVRCGHVQAEGAIDLVQRQDGAVYDLTEIAVDVLSSWTQAAAKAGIVGVAISLTRVW